MNCKMHRASRQAMESASLGVEDQLVRPSVPVLLDDASRLRVLHPDLYTNSRLVEKTCNTFRSKLLQLNKENVEFFSSTLNWSFKIFLFNTRRSFKLVKDLLAHVDKQSQRIEVVKLQAVGTRNMMAAEVETRSEALRDQKNLIADKQELVERLDAEFKSLLMVKQEQEVLIAHLSESSVPEL